MIRYLSHKEIDKQKWDNCIENAANGLIYGYSYYLNIMSRHWDALVLGDYEAVMPLTWKSKWGIDYLYQPAFVQQSGIFSSKKVDSETINAFVKEAMKRFRFAEVTLNFTNEAEFPGNEVQVQHRNNYILDLNKPYEQLYDNYDPSFTKSLRRTKKFNMLYLESTNYEKIIELYKDLYSKRLPHFSKKSYEQFTLLCKRLTRDYKVIVRHARNSDNRLLASVVLLKDKNRLYNMISCITNDGKRVEANYFLYDRIINEFANTPVILDFEGSDIEGIASFYQKFNPENQMYPHIKYNNLPAVVKLFKR